MNHRIWSHIAATIVIGLLVSTSIGAQDQKILESLVAYDQAFLSSFAVTAVASYPTTGFDATQGYCTATVRITGDGAQIGMICQQTAIETPRFSSDRTERNYEEDGNYVLSFTKNLFVHLGTDSWKTRIEQERQSIDPTNNVVKTTTASPFYEVRPIGHDDPKNRIYRYLLPMGRGFSDLLDQVVSTETMENGLLKVNATGSFFSPNPGEWEIQVDPQSDYLVREATFTRDGSEDKSTMICDPSGAVSKSDLPLWNRGTLNLTSNYDITVQLTAYSSQMDGDQLGQIKSAVNTVEEHSTVLDFNTPNENGKPLVIRGIGVP